MLALPASAISNARTPAIVATAMVDPVRFGLAASEARPGGHVTGILISLDALPGKQLALALEVVPGAAKVGVLMNALNPTTAVYRAGIEAGAGALPIKLVPVAVRGSDDLDAAFQEFLHEKVELVFVAQDSLLFQERVRLAGLATAARLPTMYGLREHVEAGGLGPVYIHRVQRTTATMLIIAAKQVSVFS